MTRESFTRLVDRTLWVTDALGIAVIIVMMIHVTLDVAVKYFGLPPLAGTTEIVSYWYMPVIAFLPLAAVERQNAHIRADLLEQFGSAFLVRAGEIVAHIVSAGFYLLFAYTGWWAAQEKREIGAFVMGVDAVVTWPTYYMVPIGCLLMALMVIIRLFGLVLAPSSHSVAEEAHA